MLQSCPPDGVALLPSVGLKPHGGGGLVDRRFRDTLGAPEGGVKSY